MRRRRYTNRTTNARPRNEAGVTLIETLAGMIMLSMGLLTLLPLMTIAIGANELARDTNDAQTMLQNRIEFLRTQDVITAGYEVDPNSGMASEWWSETDPDGLEKVIVEVTWETDLGVVRSQRATTYLFRGTTGVAIE
jgi:Tfp pilus assembly protein PilV